jgi:dTDP-D-glucose 4,6-dehydratase
MINIQYVLITGGAGFLGSNYIIFFRKSQKYSGHKFR